MDGNLATSRRCQAQRRIRSRAESHAKAIVRRVRELHPRDPAKQRRALQRWASVLAANDPEVSVALLEAPLRRTG